MCQHCPALNARCEELEERVRQLEAEVYNREWMAPSEIRLTFLQVRILQALMRSSDRAFSKEFLLEASRGPRCVKSDASPKMIDTVICKMREKMRPYGLEIETVYGRGYRLPAQARDRLLSWNSARAEAA